MKGQLGGTSKITRVSLEGTLECVYGHKKTVDLSSGKYSETYETKLDIRQNNSTVETVVIGTNIGSEMLDKIVCYEETVEPKRGNDRQGLSVNTKSLWLKSGKRDDGYTFVEIKPCTLES